MVEDIEELRAELQIQILFDGGILNCRKVDVPEAGANQEIPA